MLFRTFIACTFFIGSACIQQPTFSSPNTPATCKTEKQKKKKRSRSRIGHELIMCLIQLAHQCNNALATTCAIKGETYSYPKTVISSIRETLHWGTEILEQLYEDESQFSTHELEELLLKGNQLRAQIERLTKKTVAS